MTKLSDINFGTTTTAAFAPELTALRNSNSTAIAQLDIPTRKTESWKYSAKHLKLPESFPKGLAQGTYNPSYEVDCLEIIVDFEGNATFKNEQFAEHNIELTQFSDLSESQLKLLEQTDESRAKDLLFANLNSAQFPNGLFISVAKNTLVNKPIKLVFQGATEGTSLPRVYVHVLGGASLTLIEELVQEAISGDSFISSVIDVRIEDNARLQYLRMNITNENAKHVALTQVELMRNANLKSYCLGLGSAVARHDFHVKMLEPGAECELNGVCVTKDAQHYDNHTCIEHIAPHCTSNETYRCIADDKSHIVFNGRIHIHQDAQKTLGDMSNKNLLLSSSAEIDSKPELEIYADDVKCAHGTTIGQLDETELYYLQTRGVTEAQARLMLTLGFVLEIVRAVPIENIAEFWEQQLSTLLSYQA